MADEPTQSADDQRKQLEAEEEKARDALIAAIRDWSDVRRRIGYHDGYLAGRKAAYDTISTIFAKTTTETTTRNSVGTGLINTPAPARGRGLGASELIVSGGRVMSTKYIVLDAIRDNPGLLGVELLQKIHDSGMDLNERTFRTALFRLKVPPTEMPAPGHIMAINNRWYRIEDAPPDVVESLRESRRQFKAMYSASKEHGGQ